MKTTSADEGEAQRRFRDVLGQLPTGVAVIASQEDSGALIGMAVGSLASVSLEPPLVSFMAARTSSTFPRILETGRFTASVLASDQEQICRRFAIPGGAKFEGLESQAAPSGLPLIPGAMAWIDCEIVATHEAGDHIIAIGAAMSLHAAGAGSPMVFFRGGYGEFATKSLTAAPQNDLMEPLRLAGRARSILEELARELDLEAHASASVRGHYVVAALADPPDRSFAHSRLGYRAPLAFPVGASLVAWSADVEDASAGWMPADPGMWSLAKQQLERVRHRRWSLALAHPSYDKMERVMGEVARSGGVEDDERSMELVAALPPELFEPAVEIDRTYAVRLLSAPVFGPDETVVLAIGLRGFEGDLSGRELDQIATRLVEAADRLTTKLGGTVPGAVSEMAYRHANDAS